MKRYLSTFCAACLLMLPGLPAAASSLVGAEILIQWAPDGDATPFQATAIVGDGLEARQDFADGAFIAVDFSASSFEIIFRGRDIDDSSFFGRTFFFSDLDFGPAVVISGLVLAGATAEFSTFSFTSDSITVVTPLTSLFGAGETRSLSFAIQTSVIPLPAAGWLLLSALAVLFGVRRRVGLASD